VFGALKRIDSSYAFRAHGLFLLTIIASSKHKAEHLEKEAKVGMMEYDYLCTAICSVNSYKSNLACGHIACFL
jgi:hypothetical protein